MKWSYTCSLPSVVKVCVSVFFAFAPFKLHAENGPILYTPGIQQTTSLDATSIVNQLNLDFVVVNFQPNNKCAEDTKPACLVLMHQKVTPLPAGVKGCYENPNVNNKANCEGVKDAAGFPQCIWGKTGSDTEDRCMFFSEFDSWSFHDRVSGLLVAPRQHPNQCPRKLKVFIFPFGTSIKDIKAKLDDASCTGDQTYVYRQGHGAGTNQFVSAATSALTGLPITYYNDAGCSVVANLGAPPLRTLEKSICEISKEKKTPVTVSGSQCFADSTGAATIDFKPTDDQLFAFDTVVKMTCDADGKLTTSVNSCGEGNFCYLEQKSCFAYCCDKGKPTCKTCTAIAAGGQKAAGDKMLKNFEDEIKALTDKLATLTDEDEKARMKRLIKDREFNRDFNKPKIESGEIWKYLGTWSLSDGANCKKQHVNYDPAGLSCAAEEPAPAPAAPAPVKNPNDESSDDVASDEWDVEDEGEVTLSFDDFDLPCSCDLNATDGANVNESTSSTLETVTPRTNATLDTSPIDLMSNSTIDSPITSQPSIMTAPVAAPIVAPVGTLSSAAMPMW